MTVALDHPEPQLLADHPQAGGESLFTCRAGRWRPKGMTEPAAVEIRFFNGFTAAEPAIRRLRPGLIDGNTAVSDRTFHRKLDKNET